METRVRDGAGSAVRPRVAGERWPLQDAKARFSEVVRLAREQGPQRVTVHGRDAVVIIAAEDYDELHPPLTGQALVDMMAGSPLGDIDLERDSFTGPVRDVDL